MLKNRLLCAAAVAAVAMLAVLPARAAELMRVESPHSVADTADRLVAAIEGAGAKVFARVDHAGGAASVDIDIPANQLVIFGNPKIGSPVIRDAATAGLDLPLKVLVFDDGGQTVLAYRAPADLAAAHGLAEDHPSIATMTGALGKLTAKAAE